jgi:hypothetical protein
MNFTLVGFSAATRLLVGYVGRSRYGLFWSSRHNRDVDDPHVVLSLPQLAALLAHHAILRQRFVKRPAFDLCPHEKATARAVCLTKPLFQRSKSLSNAQTTPRRICISFSIASR